MGNNLKSIEVKKNKHEPIIWEKEESNGPLEDFFQFAKELNFDYVIYVQDSSGGSKSVWACAKEDFVECMFTFSNKCYFGRVQSLSIAILYGFFDMTKDN